jgi:acyl-CoA dehydrogenase
MMTILAHGTEYQKEKFLKPLLNSDKHLLLDDREALAPTPPACRPPR